MFQKVYTLLFTDFILGIKLKGKTKVMSGSDHKGSYYPNIDEMWQVQLNNKQSKYQLVDPVGSTKEWYHKANQYWNASDATYNGILGGYGNLSQLDINFSLKFMLQLIQQLQKTQLALQRTHVLDCGAGIGRIAKQMLCQVFKKVDIIDQCQKYIIKSKELLVNKNIEDYYIKGLQEFQFQKEYDCVWIQWVISHLSDKDAISFFIKAKKSLRHGGIIIMKQNHSNNGFLVDKDDYSVTRCTQLYKKLFQGAGLTIIREQTQNNWPQSLFMVRIYALR